MKSVRIFISSVQKEFTVERAALRDYLRRDALMRRFFEVFLFEELPAADRQAGTAYLDEPLYLTQYIERMGTGTGDMIRRCREAGLKGPEFRIEDGFRLTIWRKKDHSGETKMSGEKLPGMLGKIVRIISGNPDITIPEIARQLRRTERTIERQITQLKADEIIGRIGPKKGGHWEVLR